MPGKAKPSAYQFALDALRAKPKATFEELEKRAARADLQLTAVDYGRAKAALEPAAAPEPELHDRDLGVIDRDSAHPRALQLLPDEFFWDCSDELAPFGSDEGYTALAEFRDWRAAHPRERVLDFLLWTIESVGEVPAAAYDDTIYREATVRAQIADPDFDDDHLIYVTDVSVIATVFGQLADEGTVDAATKPYARRALERQTVWGKLRLEPEDAKRYAQQLAALKAALAKA